MFAPRTGVPLVEVVPADPVTPLCREGVTAASESGAAGSPPAVDGRSADSRTA